MQNSSMEQLQRIESDEPLPAASASHRLVDKGEPSPATPAAEHGSKANERHIVPAREGRENNRYSEDGQRLTAGCVVLRQVSCWARRCLPPPACARNATGRDRVTWESLRRTLFQQRSGRVVTPDEHGCVASG